MITNNYVRITIKYGGGAEEYIYCDLNSFVTAEEFNKAYKKFIKRMGRQTSKLVNSADYFKDTCAYVSSLDVISICTDFVTREEDSDSDDNIELFDPIEAVTDGLHAIYDVLVDVSKALKEMVPKKTSTKKILLESKKEK